MIIKYFQSCCKFGLYPRFVKSVIRVARVSGEVVSGARGGPTLISVRRDIAILIACILASR